MPSHTKKGQCGQAVRGDGFLLTETDVEFNDYADRLAKAAVDAHRVPYRTRQEVEADDILTIDNAKWIARATVMADQQPDDPPGTPRLPKPKRPKQLPRSDGLKRTQRSRTSRSSSTTTTSTSPTT